MSCPWVSMCRYAQSNSVHRWTDTEFIVSHTDVRTIQRTQKLSTRILDILGHAEYSTIVEYVQEVLRTASFNRGNFAPAGSSSEFVQLEQTPYADNSATSCWGCPNWENRHSTKRQQEQPLFSPVALCRWNQMNYYGNLTLQRTNNPTHIVDRRRVIQWYVDICSPWWYVPPYHRDLREFNMTFCQSVGNKIGLHLFTASKLALSAIKSNGNLTDLSMLYPAFVQCQLG